ncbi:MAG: ABC transporter ATP-binding protein/permease [Defluviitaleaceae bacterium]|nr:ABC transporter ATP-binding protein/permease [Defluviitaleaceae bacterium]
MNEFEENDYLGEFEMNVWKKFFFHLKEHKKIIVALILTFVGIAITEAIFPLMTRYAIDILIIGNSLDTINIFGIFYIGLTFLFSALVFFMVNFAGRLETDIAYTVRKKSFENLQRLSYSFYDTTNVGYIMARLTADANKLGTTVAWSLTHVVWGVAIIIIYISVMIFINPFLTAISLLVMPFLFLLRNFFKKLMLQKQREIRKQNSKITSGFAECINSARTTKTLTREDKNFEEFNEMTAKMNYLGVGAHVLNSFFNPVVISLSNIGIGLVLWQGSNQAILGNISFGTLSLFISYTLNMFDPIQLIASELTNIQSAQASAERLVSLIEIEPDVQDSKEIIDKYGDLFNPKTENWPQIQGNIEFKNVGFKYKTGEEIFNNFNLNIKAGEKVALVGHTGAGKSTIVNMICRFYEPTEGELLIDGVDYRNYSQIWLQSNLGYVLQAPHLFSTTIMENIRYGNPSATDEEVIKAAKIVNAYDFIQRMEHGFDTQVGEGGSKLSVGEKQLVSFARAVLKNPKIFVLDEATASIDTITEQIIQDAVDKLLEGRTSFIVAHRLSTIKSCDKIIVLENGKIIEMGSHKELFKLKGHYHKLYTNQFLDEASKVYLQ